MKYSHTKNNLAAESEYPKLVRDKIPEIVKRDGKIPETRIAKDDEEMLKVLMAKLIEESTELAEASNKDHQTEELADVYEVLSAIETVIGATRDDINKIQVSKRNDRGGFDERIIMTSKP